MFTGSRLAEDFDHWNIAILIDPQWFCVYIRTRVDLFDKGGSYLTHHIIERALQPCMRACANLSRPSPAIIISLVCTAFFPHFALGQHGFVHM